MVLFAKYSITLKDAIPINGRFVNIYSSLFYLYNLFRKHTYLLLCSVTIQNTIILYYISSLGLSTSLIFQLRKWDSL